MVSYYSELTEFNRLTYDSKNTSQQAGILIFARMFPLAATEADVVAMTEFVALARRWQEITLVAPRPISVPQYLRCCCCRRTERTSCGFFYKLLFGEIKQLGIVLKNQFQADHHWVKTADGSKLDCMFFRGTENSHFTSTRKRN